MHRRRDVNPETRAQHLLDRLDLRSIPIPVERVARALGAELRLSPLDDELSGMIYIKDGVPIIGVNSLHHPNRQRFTVAHECGHLELHRDAITGEVHVDKQFRVLMRDANSSTGADRMERQANWFAAALLMPRQLLLDALDRMPADIDDESPFDNLAKKFKVSKQALEFRIRNLSIR